MKQFNMFNSPDHDFDNFMNIRNDYAYINKQRVPVFITTSPEFKNTSYRFISTKTPIKMGDLVFYQDRYWMIISQADVKRHENYRGKMQLIEHDIYFNLKQIENSIRIPLKYLIKVPALVEFTSDATIIQSVNAPMELLDGELHIKIQDNAVTKLIAEMRGSRGRIIFGKIAWEIIHASWAEKGVFDLTCRVGLIEDDDDLDNGVAGMSYNPELVDMSMYMSDVPDSEPDVGLPSPDLDTNVELTSYDESGFLNFSKDSNVNNFPDIKSYRVVVVYQYVFGEQTYSETVVDAYASGNASINIGTGHTEDSEYGWYVKISAIYSKDGNTVELRPQTFTDKVLDALLEEDGGNPW